MTTRNQDSDGDHDCTSILEAIEQNAAKAEALKARYHELKGQEHRSPQRLAADQIETPLGRNEAGFDLVAVVDADGENWLKVENFDWKVRSSTGKFGKFTS